VTFTRLSRLLNVPAQFRAGHPIPSALPAGTLLRTEAQNLDQERTLWDLEVEKISMYNVAIEFRVTLSPCIKSIQSRNLLKFHKLVLVGETSNFFVQTPGFIVTARPQRDTAEKDEDVLTEHFIWT